MSTRDRVTDEQLELIERIVPSPSVRSDGRGRPWKNNREALLLNVELFSMPFLHSLLYPSLLTQKQRFFLSESLLCSQNSLDQSRWHLLSRYAKPPGGKKVDVQVEQLKKKAPKAYVNKVDRIASFACRRGAREVFLPEERV